MTRNKKNIIIFHMESINCELMSRFDYCFTNLNSFKSKMRYYRNYYSSATSTLMAIADLLYGDPTVFEESNYLEDIFSIKTSKKSMLSELHSIGYSTKMFFISHPYNAYSSMNNLKGVVNPEGGFFYSDLLDEFNNDFLKEINRKEPFAFFVSDFASHIAYSFERKEKKYIGIQQEFENRCKRLDDTIGIVLRNLTESKKLDDTIILFYGDHGEEYFFHDLHQGFTHAIEPLNSVIHCPLFLYCNGIENTICNELLSTTDIRTMIFQLLEGSNVDINNKYVFSRNLFKNQTRLKYFLNKSYAITNDKFTFIISKRGIGLFCNIFDPQNSFNLLKLFHIKGTTIVFNKMFRYSISGHFNKLFSDEFINEIEQTYEDMSLTLKQKLKDMNLTNININTRKKLYVNRISLFDYYIYFRNTIKQSIKKLFIR